MTSVDTFEHWSGLVNVPWDQSEDKLTSGLDIALVWDPWLN